MTLFLRVSDNASWAIAFEASGPQDLPGEIRAAWDAYIEKKWDFDRLGHPALAYRIRIGQVDRWLKDRLENDPRAADPVIRRGWERQARSWRSQASGMMGECRRTSPLYLHVWEFGRWNTISTSYGGCSIPDNPLQVVRVETDPDRLWSLAHGAAEHVRRLAVLIKDVGDIVRRPPELKIVVDNTQGGL